MGCFLLGETEPFNKNEPKASFPGLGDVTWKELERFFVLYCFCKNSLGFGLLKSRADLQQPCSP